MSEGIYLLEICVPIDKVLHIKAENEKLMLLEQDFPDGSMVGVQLIYGDNTTFLALSDKSEVKEQVWMEYQKNRNAIEYYEIVGGIDNASGISLVCLIPNGYIDSLIHREWIKFAVIMVVVVLLVSISVYFTVAIFTAQLNEFLNRMNEKLNDILEFKTDFNIVEKDFIGIEKKVLTLVQNTREYCNKLQKIEDENSRLELELLQMRLNPHFLYNTLTAIRSRIQDESIRRTIDSLIRYYRIVLSKGYLNIRIAEEIKMIEEYVEIVKSTYQLTGLNIQYEVQEEAKDFMIIKHLLQPIVENAIEHGVRANRNVGTIWIRVKLSERDVIFEIEDNGVGMTSEQIRGVFAAPEYSSTGGGYGIYNVKQRVETYYGAEYGISFHSKLGEGTLVILRVPQKKEI